MAACRAVKCVLQAATKTVFERCEYTNVSRIFYNVICIIMRVFGMENVDPPPHTRIDRNNDKEDSVLLLHGCIVSYSFTAPYFYTYTIQVRGV